MKIGMSLEEINKLKKSDNGSIQWYNPELAKILYGKSEDFEGKLSNGDLFYHDLLIVDL